MQIPALGYRRPTTLLEACQEGARLGEAARYLAGGTDLLIDLKQRRVRLEHVISLAALEELRSIALGEVVLAEGQAAASVLRIGARATLSEVAASALVREHAPGLAEAIETMAAVQIRNRATIGGNFCASVPCADTPPMCIAYEAALRIATPGGERVVLAESFFRAPRVNVLTAGELLAEILLPLEHSADGTRGAAYERFSRRRSMSLAVAAAAVCVQLKDGHVTRARLALTSVAPTPYFAEESSALLVGQEPSAALLAQVAASAAAEALPISDLRGSATYRRDLVQELTTRALSRALARAAERK